MPSIRKHRIANDALRAAAILLVCFGWLLLALGARAQNGLPKTKPTGYVDDFAGVLSPAAQNLLTGLCTEVDQKAKAQIAVVTVKSLDGKPVEDFAIDLATRWGVGPKQSDRGVLILVATQDHKYWTTVGYGLEPILPDGKVGGFGREAVPYSRDGNYDAALLLMTRRIADVIAQDRGVTLGATTSLPPARTARREQRGNGPSPIFIILLIIFLVSLVANFIRRGGGRGGRGSGSGWWVGPMIGGMMGGGGGFGGGGFGGGSGGGGFGGFGGGSFGGGGAGGSW
ncbi:MAG TPA: TPM domain-containing protein [Candidatus Acidoferrales bacterium]|nr:TPM domain-containing protein [Candidatus Acidoferrales bacterium]